MPSVPSLQPRFRLPTGAGFFISCSVGFMAGRFGLKDLDLAVYEVDEIGPLGCSEHAFLSSLVHSSSEIIELVDRSGAAHGQAGLLRRRRWRVR